MVNTDVINKHFARIALLLVTMLIVPRASADLVDLTGLTEVQVSAAAAVDDLCTKLNIQTSYTETQTQLLWACNAFIHTANDILNTGPTTYSLNLTEEEIISVLAELAHEEATINGDVFTELSQNAFATVASRLRSLRKGGNRLRYRYQFSINETSFTTNQLSNAAEQEAVPFNSNWSYYLNGNFNNGNKDETDREGAFDFQSNGLTLGLDYRLSPRLFVGSALTYSNLDLEIDYKDYDDGTKINGYDLSLYGSYFKGSAYVNALLGIGLNQLENKRIVPTLSGTSITSLSLSDSEAVTGYTNAKTMSFSITAGSDKQFSALSLSHYGQLDYSHVIIDEYDEEGDSPLLLHIDEENIDSLSFSLGTQVSHTNSYSFGVLSEFFRAEWRHEFALETRRIDAYYVYDDFDEKSTFTAPSDKPDLDYYSIGVGATLVLPMGLQVFAYYEKLFDLQYYDNQFFTVGVRAENF